MHASPRLPGALHRSRGAVAAATALLLIAAAAVWATIALALPPGGPSENRGGASIAITAPVVKPVAAGDAATGIVSFTGSGFAAGEALLVKVDDGAVSPDKATRPPVPAGVTPQSDDWIAIAVATDAGTISGTVDLRNVVDADDAEVASGKHLLRFVSSQPRSIHADFVVRPGTLNTGSTDGGTARAALGPAADQPVSYLADHPYDDIPSFVPGSFVPYRLTGLPPNQVISVKVDNGGTGNPYNPPAPRPNPLNPGANLAFDVWDSFRTDGSGNARGLLPIPTDASFAGGHIVRFLGAADATATPAVPGRSVWAAFAIDAAAPARTVDVAASGQRGRSVTLTGSGLRKQDFYVAGGTGNTGDGQTVTARIDGTGTPFHVRANDDGTLSAQLPIPADTPLGTHEVVLYAGFRAGSDFPQTVIRRSFAVTEFVPDPVVTTPTGTTHVTTPTLGTPPTTPTTTTATTPAPAPRPRAAKVASTTLKATSKGRFTVSLVRGSAASRATVSVRTKGRVRAPGARKAAILTLVKARTVTIQAGTTKQRTLVALALTKQARALLRRDGKVRVVVRVVPKGAKAFTKTLTLRG